MTKLESLKSDLDFKRILRQKKIQTNYFCKSNHWSKRMLKIKEIVKSIIKINELDFKKNNTYILNLIFVDDKKLKILIKHIEKRIKLQMC